MSDKQFNKVAVIGSGPAGFTAALYLARADLEPILYEGEFDGSKMIPGGQLMTTTEVENYPGFPDGGISGPAMMDKFRKQCVEFGTKNFRETISDIEVLADGAGFTLTIKSSGEKAHFRAVVLATGATAKYLGLKGEETYANRGVSACATCDGALPRFRKKPLVVVGGGDTAAEEAMFLARFASKVYVVHRRDELRASKVMAKRLVSHPKVEMKWNSVVKDLLGDDKGLNQVIIENTQTKETETLDVAGYFAAIGHKPNSDLVSDLVDTDEAGYIVTKPDSTYTKVEGLFACGDVQDNVYRQAVTAAGSGCAAAIDATRWLEAKEAAEEEEKEE